MPRTSGPLRRSSRRRDAGGRRRAAPPRSRAPRTPPARPRPRCPERCRARARRNRRASGHPQRIARSSQRGTPWLLYGSARSRLGQHVDVHQPPALRPELLVKAPAERLDLQPCAALGRKQPSVRGRTSIDPGEYLRRLPDRAFGRDEHGNGEPAAGAPRGEAVDALHVALLAVGHAAPAQAPSAPSRSSC